MAAQPRAVLRKPSLKALNALHVSGSGSSPRAVPAQITGYHVSVTALFMGGKRIKIPECYEGLLTQSRPRKRGLPPDLPQCWPAKGIYCLANYT